MITGCRLRLTSSHMISVTPISRYLGFLLFISSKQRMGTLCLIALRIDLFHAYSCTLSYVSGTQKFITWENIKLSHFNDMGGCIGTTTIKMDKKIRDSHYDAYTSFRNLTLPEDAPMGKNSICAGWSRMRVSTRTLPSIILVVISTHTLLIRSLASL